MALDDIDDLPDSPAAGQTGHRVAHAKIHSGLKSIKQASGFDVNLIEGNSVEDGVVYRDAEIQAAFNARKGRIGPGIWHVSGQITANNGCDVVLDGATIISHYTASFAITQSGTCLDSGRNARAITAGATLGSRVITTDTAGIVVGDWLMIRSNDLQENDPSAKTGMMRQVTSVDATTVTLDTPFYRDFPTTPLCVRISLAPKMSITGNGTIYSATPASSKKALVNSFLGYSPHVGPGITMGPNGGPGFQIVNCVNALSEASYVDLIDNGANGNYGYGVNESGTSRNTNVIGGTAMRVRHAFTTNNSGTAVHADFPTGNYGEPEDFYVGGGFTAIQCTSAGFDTHEPGRRGIIEVISIDCQIGAQDRAVETTMLIKQIVRPQLYGIHIAASAVSTTWVNVQVRSPMTSPGAGAALIRARAAYTLISPQISSAPAGWVGINADAGADATIAGGGYIAGSRTGPGVVRVQSADGSSVMLAADQTDIRTALATYGLIPSAGNINLSLGSSGTLTAGTVTSRIVRATATNVADIVGRFDGMTGQTGDLAQFRVNGVNRFLITAPGDIETFTAGRGLIMKSPNGTRYKVTIADGGTIVIAAA